MTMRNPINKFNWPAGLLALGGVCAFLVVALSGTTPPSLRWAVVVIVLIGAASLLVGLGTLAVWAVQALLQWIKESQSRSQKTVRIAVTSVLLLVVTPFAGMYVFAPIVMLPVIFIQAL